MRISGLASIIFGVSLMVTVCPAVAQNQRTPVSAQALAQKKYDPSDLYLEVYQLSESAKKLSKSGDHEAALNALLKADSYLKAIAEDHPEWKSNIVRYRTNENTLTIKKLKEIVQKRPGKKPSGKTDMVDGYIIRPNDTSKPNQPTQPGRVIMPKTEHELKLEEQIRQVMAELDQTRERAESAERELENVQANQNDNQTKIAALEAELEALRSLPTPSKSARETEIEKELEALAQSDDPQKDQKKQDLEKELERLHQAQQNQQNNKAEDLERQISSLRNALRVKTKRELDLEKQVKDLRQNISSVRSEREKVLQQKLDETINQLADANERANTAEALLRGRRSGDKDYQLGTLEKMNQDLMKTQAELSAVTRALRSTRTQLEEALERAAKAEAGEVAYKGQLTKLRDQVEEDNKAGNKMVKNLTDQLADLEKKLEQSAQVKEKSNQEIAQLKRTLSETEAQLGDVSTERDALKVERDQLKDVIKLNNPAYTKDMLDKNIELAKQLKDSQDRVVLLESSVVSQAGEIESAKTELAFVKKRMIELRDENTDYRKRVSELNEKLRVADSELERLEQKPETSGEVLEENKLLREAISKQLRVLTSRVKSRELLEAAYKRLKLEDPQMANAIEMLNQEEQFALTEEEQKLLEKNPDAAALSGSDATMVAPGYSSPEQQAKAYANLQVEVEALGSGAANAFEKGRIAAAEQLYQTLLDKHPGHYPGHVNLGVIYLKEGKVVEAKDILQNAVDLNPDHPVGQFLLGIAHYRVGEDAAAQMAFMASSQLDPANARVFFYLGNIASSSGKTEQAIKHYQRALELDESLVDVYFNIATTYLNAGKIKEAKKHYDLAIRAGALPDLVLENKLQNATGVTQPQKLAEEDQTPKLPDEPTENKDQTPEQPKPDEKPADPQPEQQNQPGQ